MTDRGYGRISLDTLRSGSIGKQHERIKGSAKGELAWYPDESVSGSKVAFADRPAGARLLADLRSGDRVLVTKIDRAARSVKDLLALVELIEAKGCSIIFIDQNIDTSGPTGRFLLTLLGAIAELEAAIIAERRRESLEAFATQGRHAVGKAPFGLKSVERADGRGLVIEPEHEKADGFSMSPADMVRSAIKRVMAGESQDTVRRSLDEHASPSAVARHAEAARNAAVGGRAEPRALFTEMSKTGFSKLLRNPRLAGMTPKGEGVVTVDGVPRIDPNSALLSVAEWRALQERLGDPAKTWSRTEGLGAALSCVVCGGRLYRNVSKRQNLVTGAGHDTYVCNRTKHVTVDDAAGRKKQSAPSVMCHLADEHLERTFLELFGDRRALVASVVDEDAARLEAVSLAQVRLDEAQRRYVQATDEDDESEALEMLQAAKFQLRQARTLPTQTVYSVVETGSTVAEVWSRASSDERTRLLCLAGKWTLDFGRGPVRDRIALERDELLGELLTHTVGSTSNVHEDSGGFLI